MKDLVKSNLWMPEIMQISSLLNEKRKNVYSNKKNNHSFWDIYKKSDPNSSIGNKKGTCLPMVKSTFVKDSVKYFYWNRYPNMIIDLDWFELNRKTPSNIILIHKK